MPLIQLHQVRDLRNATSRKEKVLRRAATLLDEYRFSLEQAYFKAEKRTVPAGERAALDGLAVAGLNAAALSADGPAAASKNRRTAEQKGGAASALAGLAGGQSNEVVEIISQNEGMKSALKRLSDVLTPFLNEENTDVSAQIYFS